MEQRCWTPPLKPSVNPQTDTHTHTCCRHQIPAVANQSNVLFSPPEDSCVLQDVQYSDIDYMDRQLNFVLDPEFSKLPALVKRIQDEGGRFIIILVTKTAEQPHSRQTGSPLKVRLTCCVPGPGHLWQRDAPLPRLRQGPGR